MANNKATFDSSQAPEPRPLDTPLSHLPFPVVCKYCDSGPFHNAIEVDEHITEEHLPEAVWNFADDFMRGDRP